LGSKGGIIDHKLTIDIEANPLGPSTGNLKSPVQCKDQDTKGKIHTKHGNRESISRDDRKLSRMSTSDMMPRGRTGSQASMLLHFNLRSTQSLLPDMAVDAQGSSTLHRRLESVESAVIGRTLSSLTTGGRVLQPHESTSGQARPEPSVVSPSIVKRADNTSNGKNRTEGDTKTRSGSDKLKDSILTI